MILQLECGTCGLFNQPLGQRGDPNVPTLPHIYVRADRPLHELRIQLHLEFDENGVRFAKTWDEHHILHGRSEVILSTAGLGYGGRVHGRANPWVSGDDTYGGWRPLSSYYMRGHEPDRGVVTDAVGAFAWAAAEALTGSQQFDGEGRPRFQHGRWGMFGVADTSVGPVWNWRSNASMGSSLLETGFDFARRRPAAERALGRDVPNFTVAQAMLEAWNRFGVGESYWDPGNGKWLKRANTQFADSCWGLLGRHPGTASMGDLDREA